MSKSQIFIGIAISFAAGILLASQLSMLSSDIFGVGAACVSCLGVCMYFGHKVPALLALFAVAAVGGALRLQISQVPNEYKNLFDTKQQLEGYIVEDIDIRINNQMFTFQPNSFSQRVLVTASKYDTYAYGDWVVVQGKIQQPENFDSFDYQKYLERFNIYAVVKYPRVLILKNGRGNKLFQLLYYIKHRFTDNIAKKLPEPDASLLLGILIGARKTLPPDIIDNFNATGVSHIIAISGYNISIIVGALNKLARYIGRRVSFWLSLFLIISFVIVTGASASVVRAGVMGALLLVSFNIGRQYAVGPALFFAGFVMLLLNPKILFWDVGFQLSFAATLGIVYFMPLLEKLFAQWGSWFGLKSTVLVTMSAIAATLPLLLLNFGRLSIVAPIVNLLVLPLVPLAMLLGFLVIVPWLGQGFAFLSHLLLTYILHVTSWFARLPYASVNLPVTPWAFALLYLSLGAVYFMLRLKLQHQELAAVEAEMEL